MSPEMIEIVLSWIVSTTLLFVVVIVDERRFLTEEQLERAWPPSSRDAALVAFGVLALPVHFIKTRGHFKSWYGVLGIFLGLAFGIIAIVVVSVVNMVVVFTIEKALGLPAEL
jgi:hypothetical protein